MTTSSHRPPGGPSAAMRNPEGEAGERSALRAARRRFSLNAQSRFNRAPAELTLESVTKMMLAHDVAGSKGGVMLVPVSLARVRFLEEITIAATPPRRSEAGGPDEVLPVPRQSAGDLHRLN